MIVGILLVALSLTGSAGAGATSNAEVEVDASRATTGHASALFEAGLTASLQADLAAALGLHADASARLIDPIAVPDFVRGVLSASTGLEWRGDRWLAIGDASYRAELITLYGSHRVAAVAAAQTKSGLRISAELKEKQFPALPLWSFGAYSLGARKQIESGATRATFGLAAQLDRGSTSLVLPTGAVQVLGEQAIARAGAVMLAGDATLTIDLLGRFATGGAVLSPERQPQRSDERDDEDEDELAAGGFLLGAMHAEFSMPLAERFEIDAEAGARAKQYALLLAGPLEIAPRFDALLSLRVAARYRVLPWLEAFVRATLARRLSNDPSFELLFARGIAGFEVRPDMTK